MSENQDNSSHFFEQVSQPNNTLTFTVPILPMSNKHKMTQKDFDAPLKKNKISLVPIEKMTTKVENNNLQNLESTCSVSGCSTSSTVIAEDDSSKEKIKTEKGTSFTTYQRKSSVCKTINILIAKDDSHRGEMKKKRRLNSICSQTENNQLLSIRDLCNNAKAIKFYTGCNDYEQFMRVFGTLGPEKYDLRYFDNAQPVNLSHLDQFLVVLILLKQHKSHYEIGIMFNITLKDIKNIFITWIRFLRMEWNHIRIKKAQKLTTYQNLAVLNSHTGANEQLFQFSDEDCMEIIVLENDKSDPIENNSKLNGQVLQFSNKGCVEIIDLGNDKPDPIDYLKKMYKIILDGPANYIESHLAKDVQFVCERLYHLSKKK